MAIAASMLPEFDQEMANTRRTLERVPENQFDWTPHAKSTPLGRLAAHLSTIPTWVAVTLTQDSFDVDPPGGERYTPPVPASTEEILAAFDEHVAAARHTLEETTDAHLMTPWTLKKGGEDMFTMPRVACVRTFVMSHMIHHRAQLGVYLRLLDVPVPRIYGPSADEPL